MKELPTMKIILLIILYFLVVLSVFSNEEDYIVIEQIGAGNFSILVFNKIRDDFQWAGDYRNIDRNNEEIVPIPIRYIDFFIVTDSLFKDIIELIKMSNDLIENDININNLLDYDNFNNGVFRIKVVNKGEEYNRYLNERELSIIFFYRLFNLFLEKESENKLIDDLVSTFEYSNLYDFIPNIIN